MFEVKVMSDFSGAHNLRGYKGKCEDLHGHNWKVEVVAGSEELDDLGMVVDFTELKKTLKDILQLLDHKYLNDTGIFKIHNPTSENIAKFIFEEITAKLGKVKLKKVVVWETETSSATYSE